MNPNGNRRVATNSMRLLMVEDSPRLGPILTDALRAAGYLVDLVTTAQDFLYLAHANSYALYILDLGLPDGDGSVIIARLRETSDHRPILVITARVTIEDKIAGLDLGADDYLVKPFNKDELLARIRALLRRPPAIAPAMKQMGRLSFDVHNHSIFCDGRELSLSPSEHRLLSLVLRRTDRIITPADIEQIANNLGREVTDNAVQQAISRLRKLLARLDETLVIRTVRGSGYMLSIGGRQLD